MDLSRLRVVRIQDLKIDRRNELARRTAAHDFIDAEPYRTDEAIVSSVVSELLSDQRNHLELYLIAGFIHLPDYSGECQDCALRPDDLLDLGLAGKCSRGLQVESQVRARIFKPRLSRSLRICARRRVGCPGRWNSRHNGGIGDVRKLIFQGD
jgi:hypothetical protein